LMLVSVGALAAVFVSEMLLGRIYVVTNDQTTTLALLETVQSGAVLGAMAPAMLAFFVGTGLAVRVFVSPPGPFRGPAIALGLGAALILAEIISAQVLLSQIGNILILVAGVGFARWLLVDSG